MGHKLIRFLQMTIATSALLAMTAIAAPLAQSPPSSDKELGVVADIPIALVNLDHGGKLAESLACITTDGATEAQFIHKARLLRDDLGVHIAVNNPVSNNHALTANQGPPPDTPQIIVNKTNGPAHDSASDNSIQDAAANSHPGWKQVIDR